MTVRPGRRPCAGRWGLALVVAVLATWAPAAQAYDLATTHAGLTERAVLASRLHRVLVHRLSRPLGLFEPIAFRAADVPGLPLLERHSLEQRLGALDPSTGCRPGPDGVSSALAWVIAGSVIAGTPAERGQNLYYDPSRGSGLANAGGGLAFGFGLRQLVDGSGVRSLATGTMFNMTGRPSTEWLLAPENDVGLVAFSEGLDGAIASEQPAQRANALVRALMALGGTLTVLEDAGEPAHVRNDFRGAYLASRGASPFDRGSAFERFVSDTYGRMGLPAPDRAVDRPTAMAFISAADAQGLADRTQRRFFSEGSLPEDAIVDRDTTSAEVIQDARLSLPYGYPRLPRLELSVMGKRRYAYAPGGAPVATPAKAGDKTGAKPLGRRLLAYERVPGRVRFFLDNAVYADTARALLPEIAAYGAGLVDHLFRAEIRLVVVEGGGTVGVAVDGARGAVRGGAVRIFAEDVAGRRRQISSVTPGADPVSVAIPAGTRRLAAVLRAQDDAGDLVAVAEVPVR